jgi:2-polyprenyl-6-methoxyphenol hydroxylase-like FAD-dependent oxidoreductase
MIDVLIAGAGPSGLMMAMLCKRIGLSYRIIDKNSGPVTESRAIGLQARSLELFHKLGIVDDFFKKGMKAAGAKIHLNGVKKLEIDTSDMARADTEYPFIFLHSQSDTEKIFLKEVRDVERNTKLLSFKDKMNHVESVTLNSYGDRETISSRFLCGCDGSHSVVRKGLDLEFKGGSYGSAFLMADCKVDWSGGYDKVQVFLDNGQIAVFFPLSETHSRVLSINRIPQSAEPKTEATTAYPAKLHDLETAFKKAAHLDIKLSEPKWVTRYHVHHRSVDRMRSGNVFLLGDAAHIHSPVGAQGMNTGLQDANNLAWKLKAAINKPTMADEILETYNAERMPVAKHLLNFTDRVFTAAVTQNRFFLRARNMVLPVAGKVLMNIPKGKRLLFRFISQLNIHYHSNIISRSDAIRILQAGERAPNGKLNRTTSLHDLFKGYEFHAVAFKKGTFNDLEVRRIYDQMEDIGISNVHFFRQTDVKDGYSIEVPQEIFDCYSVEDQGLFIIRPDGYIGFCANEIMAKPDFPKLNFELRNYQENLRAG